MSIGTRHRVQLVAYVLALTLAFGLAWAGMQIAFLGRGESPGIRLIAGLIYGGMMSAWLTGFAVLRRKRYRRRYRHLSDEQHDEAARAAVGGPVPTDSRVVEEALRRVRRELAQRRSFLVLIPIFATLALAGGIGAVLRSGWLWPIAALAAATAWLLTYRMRRWPGTLARLEAAATGERAQAEQTPPVESETAELTLVTRRPRLPVADPAGVSAELDGEPVDTPWGEASFAVPPGRHRLHVDASIELPFDRGTSIEVECEAGRPVRVYYGFPLITFVRGRLGIAPVSRPGLAPLLILAGIVLGSCGFALALILRAG